VDDSGQVILEEYEKAARPADPAGGREPGVQRPRTVAPVREMIQAAHRHGAKVLVDGAQAVSHMRVDVQSLDCDFYVFFRTQDVRAHGHRRGVRQVRDPGCTRPWQGGGT